MKKIIMPSEHGSWSWMLVPYVVGLLATRAFHPAALLVLSGGVSTFLIRQPATVWLRARQGRGRRADGPSAQRWILIFSGIALLSLIGLLLWNRAALLWLTLPLLILLALYLTVALRRRKEIRALWMEIAGAAALALMAPAAMTAVTGSLSLAAGFVYLLMALQNCLGVFYVRQRIADTHGRPHPQKPILISHVAAVAGLLGVVWFTAVPWPVLLPFLFFLGRATWAVRAERPVANIKRFGFQEVGIEVVSGLLIALTLW